MKALSFPILLCSLLQCCQSAKPIADTENLTSLGKSIQSFKTEFNRTADKNRVVAIVSSTCGPCVAGAVTVNESIVKSFRDADIAVLVVWIDMLPTDSRDAALRSATIFDDPRVTQFHDPKKKLGNAFGKTVTNGYTAWDIYMFFPAGTHWNNAAPMPSEYRHQLSSQVADATLFRSGIDLASDLYALTHALGYEPTSDVHNVDSFELARRSETERIASLRESEEGEQAPPQCPRCKEYGIGSSCRIAGWNFVNAQLSIADSYAERRAVQMQGLTETPDTFAQGVEDSSQVILSINGMKCQDCALGVAARVLSHDSVSGVQVSYDKEKVVVQFLSEPSDEDIKSIVEILNDADFEASVMTSANRDLSLELLSFEGCPNAAQLRANLQAAISQSGVNLSITEVDLTKLPKNDDRLRYGSPTVLINGADLMGQSPNSSAGLTCRVYPGGVPATSAIVAQLSELTGKN